MAGIAVGVGLISACANPPGEAPNQSLLVTASGTRKHPAEYDGKSVKIVGTLAIGPEMQDIYDSRAAYDGDDPDKCLAVGLTDRQTKVARRLNGHTVVIYGIFRKTLCPDNQVCLGYCSIAGIETKQIEEGLTP